MDDLGIPPTGRAPRPAPAAPPQAGPRRLCEVVDHAEGRAVRAAMADSGGNISAAARTLGVDRNTLKRKLAKHGVAPAR